MGIRWTPFRRLYALIVLLLVVSNLRHSHLDSFLFLSLHLTSSFPSLHSSLPDFASARTYFIIICIIAHFVFRLSSVFFPLSLDRVNAHLRYLVYIPPPHLFSSFVPVTFIVHFPSSLTSSAL